MREAMPRTLELVVGFALVGYCMYAIYKGEMQGKFRVFSRQENPCSFWACVSITLGIGVAFLLGAVSWRN